MKHLLSLTLLLAALPASAAEESAPNTLTPEERAAGYTLLFDGREIPGFRIEGDFQIEGGVLTLGGSKPTTATITTALPGNFELRMKYRFVELPGKPLPGISWATLELMQKRFKANRSNGQTLFGSAPPKPADWWDELFLTGVSDPTNDAFETTLQFLPEELAPQGGKSGWQGRAGNFTVSLQIPVGSKLQLRDVKLRADAVSWWQTPWPYVLILATGMLMLGIIGLLVLRRLRRRWGTADAGFRG